MYQIWAHIPRTQRVGKDSEDREEFICEVKAETEARRLVKEFENKRKEILAVGYPWEVPQPKIQLPDGKYYEPFIYDSYYIRLS